MVLTIWVFHWVCSRLQAHETLTLITPMQASPAQLVAVARKLATCCRSRFGAAFGIVPRFCDHKAAATAGFAAGKTATSCAPKAHLRDQRFFSSKAGSNCISFLTRTKANHRPSPRMVTALKRHPNTKHPTAK